MTEKIERGLKEQALDAQHVRTMKDGGTCICGWSGNYRYFANPRCVWPHKPVRMKPHYTINNDPYCGNCNLPMARKPGLQFLGFVVAKCENCGHRWTLPKGWG